MTDLNEVLKMKNGLPPSGMHELLFTRKLAGNSDKSATVNGYPCVLNDCTYGNVRKYRIHGNTNGVGDLVTDGKNQGKYVLPVVTSGKNLWNFELTDEYHLSPINGLPQQRDDRCATLNPFIYSSINSLCISYKSSYMKSTLLMYSIFDGNTLIRRVTGIQSGGKIDLSNGNKAYFAFYTASTASTISASEISDVQLEFGSEATGYEPYHELMATNIYLDKPLETGEILKYPENVLVHSGGTTEPVILPKISTFEGTTIITTDTEIQPSGMEITYKSRR